MESNTVKEHPLNAKAESEPFGERSFQICLDRENLIQECILGTPLSALQNQLLDYLMSLI